MEAKAKLTKKILSTFLAVLMIFSACYVGIDGAYTAYAAEGDSQYTADEVAALINAATAGGFTLSSSGNAWNYAADNGTVIAAAEAIFDYAVNTYRDGKEATSAANSSAGLYEKFDATFSSKYTNATAARLLVKNVLDPNGTTVYSYENPAKKTGVTGSETKTSMSAGADVSGTYPLTSYSSYYAATTTENIIKTSEIALDLNTYLMTFAKIEDIPSTIITGVKYTYAHTYSTSAKVTKVTTRTAEEGSGCDKETVTYYTPTMETAYWNYMTGKPTREVVKDKTVRKGLLLLEKYFNEERLAMTLDEMLAMEVEDIKSLYLTTEEMYKTRELYNEVVLAHFGFSSAAIDNFMDNVDFAYRAVAAKYNIDNLNNLIGSEYNEESYAEMSALYAKTNTAYNVVFNLDAEIIAYLEGEGNYSEQYASALALKTAAESYNAVLFEVMTEQKLEETVAAMVATFNEYINVLNKEDIANPSDAEVIGLVQKVEAFDAIIDSYKSYSYYRTYWTTEYESEWARFSGILDEVYEVRGLKMEFETYYDYFLPLIFDVDMNNADSATLIDIHANLDAKLSELRASYTDVAGKWGYTIADKIFTVEYEGSNSLLQTIIENEKGAGKEAIKTILIARTEAQLDAVYAYKDTTVVNFENFASIKSTLTYFDYDLYNYVNGGGEGQNKWLSTDYTNKYSMVQTLLDRYHAFSTSDGKSFFNEGFTYADADGNFAIRYAGSQYDAEGNQIGYPNDIARNGADDNFVVTEETMVNTVKKLDGFITSRDFGAIIGLVSTETEEYCDLATYVTEMLNEMLYTDELINTLVGAIYPMVVDLLNTELVGMLADMGTNDNPNASACIDLEAMEVKNAKGHLYVYMDDDLYNGKEHLQRNLDEVLADAGLYVYPQTLADSLMMSNPVAYGKGTPIYMALKDAGRDWTKLVCADDPETEQVDETKILEFAWGVYDEETFIDAMACVFDSLLPLLNAVLTGTTFNETLNNAAYVYSSDVKYSIISAGNIAAYGHLNLNIPGLTVFNDVLVPLFEILGVDKIPTLKSGASGDDLAKAILQPILSVLDEILLGKEAAPLTKILEILPNLVYFISMDSVQEILDSLNISLNLKIEAEIDKDKSGTLADLLGGTLVDLLGDNLAFDVELAIADMIDLYDMLGFEISDFNEILEFATASMGLELPPIRQQDIIFCSDWGTSPTGRVYLNANEGDLLYWLLNYVVTALVPDENGNSLLTGLLGSDMDPMVAGIIETVVDKLTSDPKGALAAIIELLNCQEYDLAEMEWLEGQYNYGEIEIEGAADIVYLTYGNDWTEVKADYLEDNLDTLVATVLEMANVDLGADSINALIKDSVNGLFTNANITALVEMLGGLGDSPSAIIADIVGEQVGIELDTWFTAFGYLFPAETWAEDAEIIPLGHRNYVNDFGVEGTLNEDGTITWSFNKMTLVDGDGYTFINILTRLLGGANVLIEFLFAGGEISAFNEVISLKGYETYASTLGLLLTMLGVENLPTQEDFNNDAMGSFSNMLMAVLDWFYGLTASEDMLAQIIELIPNLFYYIESNGLSLFLRNLLQPVWVLVDTVRPLVDVDVNGVLSLVVSEFLNYGTLDINVILTYVLTGIYQNNDMDYKWYNIDLFDLTFENIIKLADAYLGTNLTESGLVQVGIKGFCSGLEAAETSVGTVYRPTLTAGDVLTILVTAVLDCLSYPTDDGSTNGAAIFALIGEMTGNEDIANIYPVISTVINGVEVTYSTPNWGYMFESVDDFTVTLPAPSIAYLAYTTDWTQETADAFYDALDNILDLVLPTLLEEGETIATLLAGVLSDNVYTEENLNMIVELIVNAIGGLNETLLETIEVMLAADITAWFDMCEEVDGKFVCNKAWGIDEAEDKKAAFVAGIKEVLAPANDLLAFLFFGTSFNFFTGSEKDDEGEYTYNDIITINGGEGYAYGLAPILEALGCTMPAAATFKTDDGYNVGDAVEAILDSVLALVDTISANPVEEVFNLLPNLIYFINADGIATSVKNLLAPVNALLAEVGDLIVEPDENATEATVVTLGSLLEDTIGMNIEAIDMETLLGFAADAGVQLKSDMVDIIKNLYVGNLEAFDAANGNTAYRLNVEGYEGDVLTIIVSIAAELFLTNEDLFADLVGADIYAAIVELVKGAQEEFTYQTPNWGYMYENSEIEKDEDRLADALATLEANNGYLPEYAEGSAAFIYTQYANNWNEETAENVNDLVDTIIAGFMTNNSLGQLLDNAIVNGIYSESLANSLVELVVELLLEYAGFVEAAGALLGSEELAKWFSDEYVDIDADGNVTCVKDWGFDEATTNEAKRDAFVESFVLVLEPVYRVLEWLLFGEDITLFNSSTGEALITVTGANGYDNAFVLLLEAVGATMEGAGNYVDGTSAILPASAFDIVDEETGEVIGRDMAAATRAIFGAVVDWLYALCGDLDNPEVGVIGAMLDKLPNFIYNLNAGTLDALVNNLLLPVNEVLTKLAPAVGEVDILELIDDALGFAENEDLQLNWYGVFDIVESLVNLYWPAEVQDFLATLYLGRAVPYTSANGNEAYFMTFNDDETETIDEKYLVSGREDMLTLVLSFVFDGALDKRNEAQLVDWLGQDIYDVIYAYISGAVHTLDMNDFDWAFVGSEKKPEYLDEEGNQIYADQGVVISPITADDSKFGELYNDLYTEEMGAYIEENLPLFIDTMILLLGIDTGVTDANGDPVIYRGLEDLITGTLGTTIYTRANLVSILEAIQGLLPTLKDAIGNEATYEALATVIDSVLDVDVHYWDTYEIKAFNDGDRDKFVAELVRMVRPAAPVLKWLLTGEDLIALFHTSDAAIKDNEGYEERKSTIVVEGAEGYAYGIIPLLEAFGYENEKILTPEDYEAAATPANDSQEAKDAAADALLLNVLNPLLDVVDRLLADPVNELTNILPGLLYFINSNGVDTVIKNTANAVFTVLGAIEPLTGEIDIYELLGMDLSTLNIETLIADLIADLEEESGLKLVDPALSAVKELSVGTVISYESKNGETYYTMEYATGADEVEMTSVLLRAVLYFVSIPENAEALKVLLADELDPDSYEFVASLLDNFAQMAASEDGIYEIMYTVYEIFKAANEAAAGVKDWYDTFNGDYTFLNTMFEDSDLKFINQLRESLKNLLDNSEYSDIIDGEQLAPNGFIRFFQKIAEFFQKIGDFFANLFK